MATTSKIMAKSMVWLILSRACCCVQGHRNALAEMSVSGKGGQDPATQAADQDIYDVMDGKYQKADVTTPFLARNKCKEACTSDVRTMWHETCAALKQAVEHGIDPDHGENVLAGAQQATLAMVAPGIAEALVATAMGLVAAIPAVVAYNRFSQWVEQFASSYDAFIDDFMGLLQRQGVALREGVVAEANEQ